MAKCTFNKKYTIKGYRKCKITGQILKRKCDVGYGKPHCPYYRKSLLDRFLEWIGG